MTEAATAPAPAAPAAPATPAAPEMISPPRLDGTKPPPAPTAPASPSDEDLASDALGLPPDGEEEPTSPGEPSEGTPEGSPPPTEEKPAAPALDDKAETELEYQGEKHRISVGKLKELLLEQDQITREANERIQAAESEREELREFVKDCRASISDGMWRLLWDKHKGNQQEAWKEYVTEARKIVAIDDDWRAKSPAEREAILAKQRADALEAEVNGYRKKDEEAKQADNRAQATERFFRLARPVLQKIGIPQTERALDRLAEIYQYNAGLGRKPTLEKCALLLKSEYEKARKGLAAESLAAMDEVEFIRQNPEFAKRLTQAALRLAKSKAVRAGAASGRAPANGAPAAPGQAAPRRDRGDEMPIKISTALPLDEFQKQVSEEHQRRTQKRK